MDKPATSFSELSRKSPVNDRLCKKCKTERATIKLQLTAIQLDERLLNKIAIFDSIKLCEPCAVSLYQTMDAEIVKITYG